MERPIGQLGTEHGIHETAVEASPNGVVVTDDSGAILYANSQFASIFGYLRRELLGVSIERLLSEPIGPTTTAERGQFWSAPYSRPSSARRELRGQRKDGSEVPIEVGFTIAEARGPRLVVISVVDISERKRFEREAQESSQLRLEFEHLISDMAARFVRTEPPDVDEAITSSLRLIADALGLDRCVLWQWTEDGTDLVHSHHWSRLGTEPSRPTSAREAFPWFLSKLRQDETVWFDSVDTIPSDLDRDSVRSSGEKSKAFVPMSIGPHVVGALSFAMTGTERKWDQEYLERLRLIAAVF
ncbi:MAG TPA: PAS domain S-box protein, partial [Candidatus Eisenbacteria bacterium]|nr:PAS domain S-box protein [Candidatus Eisenbacteria bacterium]